MTLLTRRFPTILGLLLLGAVAVVAWFIFYQKPQVMTEAAPSKVKITNVADNKFTVSWTTRVPATGAIEYGKVGEKLSTVVPDDRDSGASREYLTHHVTVTSLQPNTQYAFRILSGGTNSRFDNNGSPYSVATGPTIPQTPTAASLYGKVVKSDGAPADGSLVYVALPGASPVSTIVTTGGNYTFSLSTVRSADFTKYVDYDPALTIVNVEVEGGLQQSKITVTTANSEPVPNITLGQNADYTEAEIAPIAVVEPQQPEPELQPEQSDPESGERLTVLNIEPFPGSDQRGGAGQVVLLNPEREGEQIATTRPEFRGVGPESAVISITVHSSQQYGDVVVVGKDGTWSWTPPADLSPGQHTVTIAYIDSRGVEQVMTRSFLVAQVSGDPAFVSTPSGATQSPTPTPTPAAFASSTPSPSPSPSALVNYSPMPSASSTQTKGGLTDPSPREAMPDTEEGVPVSGVFSYTLLTGVVGFVIMVVGALMLAL